VRAIATVIGLATLALALGGCGGSDAETEEPPVQPTEFTQGPKPAVVSVTGATPYTRALEHLCIRRLRAHEDVGPVRTPEALRRAAPKNAAIDRRFMRDLARLEPEPSRAELARANRLTFLLAAQTDMQDTALVHLTADNVNGYFQYTEQAVATRKQAEAADRRLGAPACAVRPFSG
jgi:hypothetical protein